MLRKTIRFLLVPSGRRDSRTFLACMAYQNAPLRSHVVPPTSKISSALESHSNTSEKHSNAARANYKGRRSLYPSRVRRKTSSRDGRRMWVMCVRRKAWRGCVRIRGANVFRLRVYVHTRGGTVRRYRFARRYMRRHAPPRSRIGGLDGGSPPRRVMPYVFMGHCAVSSMAWPQEIFHGAMSSGGAWLQRARSLLGRCACVHIT